MLIGFNSTKPLYILGDGPVAKELHWWISNEGYTDINIVEPAQFFDIPTDSQCILGFLNQEYRQKWIAELGNSHQWITYIHPFAYVPNFSLIGSGSCIGPNVTLGVGVTLGKFCYVGDLVHIGHSTTLGDNVFVAPCSLIAGASMIGNNVNIGLRCTIKDQVAIVANVQLAMNTNIRKNITRPGRYFSNGLKLRSY